MASTTYYVPEGGITKQGDDWRVNLLYTTKSGNTYPLNGTISNADWAKQSGATDEAKVKARLKELGAIIESRDIAATAEEPKTTLLDDTTVTLK